MYFANGVVVSLSYKRMYLILVKCVAIVSTSNELQIGHVLEG